MYRCQHFNIRELVSPRFYARNGEKFTPPENKEIPMEE